MPTTAKGTPYVVSTDLVANYPTVSSDLADHIDDNLAYNAVSINAQTGTTYTFALADASEGKLVTASNAASSTYTVPPQSSVTWAAGAVLRILNQGAGVVTIAAGSGVTINGTPLTLAQYKGAALQRTASDTWTIIPFTGGVGNADFSDAATGTYTSGGLNYKYITYTASGTLTVTTAGFADVLLVAGGGGGGAAVRASGGGGAGGYLEITNAYLPSGTLTVTVGAGGAGGTGGANIRNEAGNNGIASRIGSYYAVGGGAGAASSLDSNTSTFASIGRNGGSGGGGSFGGAGGAADMGNAGGSGATSGTFGGGGGGGASATGSNGTTTVGGNGGNGSSNSYTGSAVTRAGGGGGGNEGGTAGTGGTGGGGAGSTGTGTGTAGSVNTGGGGGGGGRSSTTTGSGGAGGSGVVIIRVAV